MSTDLNETAGSGRDGWQAWRERRTAAVEAPYGPLSVTGTLWIADAVDGRLAGLPGTWVVSDDGSQVLLTAEPADGVAVDGELLVGRTALGADDESDPAASRVSYGARRLVLMRREEQWAVRVFDPDSAVRRDFPGIAAYPYDPEWARAGLFLPYAGGARSVRVDNADGQERGLGLAGELAFSEPGGREATLQVAVEADGGLWAVFADATSGRTSYRFRFLRTSAPDPDGAVLVDLNRVTLPPCAFSDSFLCPFPPPGNRLAFGVPVGERDLRDN